MVSDCGSKKERLKVAIVAPSLRYVGGPAVHADLLLRLWRGDPDVEMNFVGIDPPLPPCLCWAERIRGLRTILREPLFFVDLWRGFKDADIAHIFPTSYWSFLIAAAPAWLFAKVLGKKALINPRSGDARDHLHRFRSRTRRKKITRESETWKPVRVTELKPHPTSAVAHRSLASSTHRDSRS